MTQHNNLRATNVRQRLGMTLMELLVVVAILALLAMISIPKLMNIYEQSRSGVQTYSLTDVSRMVENYYGVNRKYPDGWDNLIDDSGSAVMSKIHPSITWLTTASLSAEQVTAFNNAGISHVFQHDMSKDATTGASLYKPSDTGRNRHHLGTGSGHDGTTNVNTVMTVNTTTGGDGEKMLLGNFNLNPNVNAKGGTSAAADNAALSGKTFVVFGMGPRSTVVQSLVENAPLFDSAKPSSYYSRALVIFSVPDSPTATDKARLIGVIAPDGRGVNDSLNDYNTSTQH